MKTVLVLKHPLLLRTSYYQGSTWSVQTKATTGPTKIKQKLQEHKERRKQQKKADKDRTQTEKFQSFGTTEYCGKFARLPI